MIMMAFRGAEAVVSQVQDAVLSLVQNTHTLGFFHCGLTQTKPQSSHVKVGKVRGATVHFCCVSFPADGLYNGVQFDK